MAVAGCAEAAPRPPPATPPPVATAVVAPTEAPSAAPVASDGTPIAAPKSREGADEPSARGPDSLNATLPLAVAAPPSDYTLARAVSIPSAPAPRLVKHRERKNGITDDEAWLRDNHLERPFLRVPNPFMNQAGQLPPDIPTKYRGLMLIAAIDHRDHVVLIFGANFSDGRIVAVLDAEHRLVTLLDFGAWLKAPSVKPGAERYVDESVHYAQLVGDVLYVANAHRTYAASSGGKNAYVSAVEAKTGTLLWRSQPLVANSSNFVVRGGYIVTGYGFTAEPDFVYVLDRANGRVASRVPVASGPSMLLVKDDSLHVRTYDHDYVFGFDR